MLASIWSDLRFAFRTMARRPLFSLIVVLILGVGLGANAAMFSVVDSVLLEPLPYPEADRLAWMWGRTPTGSRNTISAVDYMDYRSTNTAFEELAAYYVFPERYVLTGGDEPEVVLGTQASWNMFRALRVDPVIGRGFVAEDEQPGGGEPIILGYGLWQSRFGGDPDIVGRVLVLDENPYEVVGVMPAGFAFPSWAQLWRPMRMTDPAAQGRGNNNFLLFGRLNPGVSLERAEAEMVAIAAGIAEAYPDVKQGWSVSLVSLHEVFVGGVRGVLWLLLGAVGLVLLVACANIAALLLARAAGREGEVAVRVALGASRGRIARQVLTESVILALSGGVLGVAVAYGALEALRDLGAGSLPRLAAIGVDGTALLFTLVISLATGLLFGLAPAFRAPQLDLVQSLKEGHRGQRRAGSLGAQNMLVVGQVALSLMLLVGSGLLIRSFLRLQQEDLGFEPQGVLTAQVRLPRTYGPERPVQPFYDATLERIRALPGVEAAGAITNLPVIGGFGPWNYVHAEGHPPATPADRRGATRRVVDEGYFEAMGIALLSGRTFTESDGPDAPLVMIISRRMAEEFFPDLDPIGRHVVAPFDPPVHVQVIGVVGDVRLGPLGSDMRATMYWSLRQRARSTMNLVVRTRGNPAPLAAALRAAIWSVDPDVPISNLGTMTSVVSASLAQNRFRTLLLGTFAGVALLLAALGLYGVLSQLVGRRTHELGVRMALGADRACLVRWVLRYGMTLAGVGLAIGLGGAAASSQLARGVLFGVQPLDPFTYVATSLCLVIVALAAAAVPAWRATRVDPVESLRSE